MGSPRRREEAALRAVVGRVSLVLLVLVLVLVLARGRIVGQGPRRMLGRRSFLPFVSFACVVYIAAEFPLGRRHRRGGDRTGELVHLYTLALSLSSSVESSKRSIE